MRTMQTLSTLYRPPPGDIRRHFEEQRERAARGRSIRNRRICRHLSYSLDDLEVSYISPTSFIARTVISKTRPHVIQRALQMPTEH